MSIDGTRVGLAAEMVQRRLEEYQDLGDRVERKLLEIRGELAELGDRGGPAGGDSRQRLREVIRLARVPRRDGRPLPPGRRHSLFAATRATASASERAIPDDVPDHHRQATACGLAWHTTMPITQPERETWRASTGWTSSPGSCSGVTAVPQAAELGGLVGSRTDHNLLLLAEQLPAAAVVEAVQVPRDQPAVRHHGRLPIGLGLPARHQRGDPGKLGPQPTLLGRQRSRAFVAGAVPQTSDQQGCINHVNKYGVRVAKSHNRADVDCVKNAGRGLAFRLSPGEHCSLRSNA